MDRKQGNPLMDCYLRPELLQRQGSQEETDASGRIVRTGARVFADRRKETRVPNLLGYRTVKGTFRDKRT